MSSPQAGHLADVRAMFASLYDAERLRTLPLVRGMLESAGHDLGDPAIAATVQRTVDGAIASLDSRARSIVVRCDLGGETHRTVAADLGIGERYFYRERRRALGELAEALTKQHSAREAAARSEPLDALMGTATALRSAGRSREGMALLAASYRGERSAWPRVTLALRLAHFAAGSEQRQEVIHWVTRGRRDLATITDSPAESAIALCEFDLVEIRADIAGDEYARAERRARAVARRLTSIGVHRHRDRAAAALGEAYIYLSEAQVMRGSHAEGLALSLEGLSSLQHIGTSIPALELEAAVSIATARLLATGSLVRAADDFDQAYARAVTLGLGRDIAKISGNLALIFALRGDSARSTAFTRTASTVGRHTLTPSERVVLSVDLVAAALVRHDTSGARNIISSALPHAHGLMGTILAVAEAEVSLAGGEPQRALTLVRRAVDDMDQRGNVRFLGSAHRIEAEALAAIGQRAAAADRISDALDCLAKAGHPFSLSRAYALSARLTGNRRHGASARELQAGLEAM